MKRSDSRLTENHLRNLVKNSVKRALNEMTQAEYAEMQARFDNRQTDDGKEYERVTKEGFRLFKEVSNQYDPSVLKYLAFCITRQFGKYDPFSL